MDYDNHDKHPRGRPVRGMSGALTNITFALARDQKFQPGEFVAQCGH